MKFRLPPAALLVSLLLAPVQALAAPINTSGLYTPRPGSVQETWVLKQIAHRLRLERGVIMMLRKLKADPETAAAFSMITEQEMLLEARNHDNSKVSFSREYLEQHHLPLDDFIPEHIAQLIEAGVRPTPEGTSPVDPANPTPAEEFRIWVDRLNHADEMDEQAIRRRVSQKRAQKRALIILAADFADTGLMRGDYLQAQRRGPTEYVGAQIAAGWPRLQQLGPEVDRMIPLLAWVEEEVRPGISRWEDRMSDLHERIMLPYLRQATCVGALMGGSAGH